MNIIYNTTFELTISSPLIRHGSLLQVYEIQGDLGTWKATCLVIVKAMPKQWVRMKAGVCRY